jgi:GDPmannose 4,6-dehydratase
VARAVARIKRGLQKELFLGSLASGRDWGWAPDYVEGMRLMLQIDPVEDFILATGEHRTVEIYVSSAFAVLGLNWRDYVRFNSDLVTTVEPIAACGNAAKAKRMLGWKNTVPFDEIVVRLVRSEYDKLGKT